MTQLAIEKKVARFLKKRGEATISEIVDGIRTTEILPREIRGAIVSMLTRGKLERTLDRLRVRLPERGGVKSLAMIDKKLDRAIEKMGLSQASAKDQISSYVRTLPRKERYD